MSQKIILIAILLIAGISALRINHQNLAEQIPAGLVEKIKELYGSGFFSAFASQPDSEDEEPTAAASHEGVAENVKEHVAKAVEAAKKHPEVVKKVKSHLPHPHPHKEEDPAHEGFKELFEGLPEEAQENVAKAFNKIKEHLPHPHPHSEEASTPSAQ